ncbi:hypothetical protein AVO45_18085 [Ruegeria marisrubri]|uniref:ADP-ribosylglycohydrolase n=1 Tax=Ruegeria marisrubri TaxID=1685379 RepID=A0A0X3UAR3_9RHOB|nr:hypothetical protein AVO45_18085 [Ruegeria marisrubri]
MLLPRVIEIVREAGRFLRAEFHREGGPRGHGHHAEVDEVVENLLSNRLLDLYSVGFLGEETGRRITTSSDIWVVDPNDGTNAFLEQLRGSSISVALLRGGSPVLGVVFAPTAPDDNGDLIAWAQGCSLMRNGNPVAIPPHHRELVAETIVALNEEAGDYAMANTERIKPARFIALPSIAYRLALAAVADVDAAVSLGRLSPWDVAAGHALLIGAGREMTDMHGRRPSYDEGAPIDGCIGGATNIVSELVKRNLRKAVGVGRIPRKGVIPQRRVLLADQLNRAQGVLLGQLVGDALGSAVEFKSEAEIASIYPRGLRQIAGGGPFNTIAGQPTDDSELALALTRSLVVRGMWDEAHVTAAYVRWLESAPFDCGNTIGGSIRVLKNGKMPENSSQANGSLMRVSPIGIFHAGRPDLAARDAARDTTLTHPHPVCVAASSAYTAAIATGVGGGDREAMWCAATAYAGESIGARTIREVLTKALNKPPVDYSTKMGWVLIALQSAFFQLMRGASFTDGIVETVARGGDTDTNGAVCGALLGAVEGRKGVPLEWKRAVMSCRAMAGFAPHPRPVEYWADDALDLAEALLVAGETR